MKHVPVGVVDHRRPIHDGFCRCRVCKPSLVGARAARRVLAWERLLVLILLAAFWAAAASLV